MSGNQSEGIVCDNDTHVTTSGSGKEDYAIYLPAIEDAGDKASARNQYKDLVTKMEKVIKDMLQFKDQILAVGDKLKSKYPCRPAMVDELNRLG